MYHIVFIIKKTNREKFDNSLSIVFIRKFFLIPTFARHYRPILIFNFFSPVLLASWTQNLMMMIYKEVEVL